MASTPIQFSNTTTKHGIIQEIEFWTGLGDGGISGDATLLKVMTARVNAAFDRIAPFLYSFSDYIKWDDTNQTDLPVGTLNLVSGQSDYKITTDTNSLDILNITNVKIFPDTTSTIHFELKEMSMDDPLAIQAMSPDSPYSGVPQWFLRRGNTLFLFYQPNYSRTSGITIYFERELKYFASTDTTKEAGIPRPFQGLLPLYASYDWIIVNQPDNTTLITRLEAQISRREKELRNAIDGRNPKRTIMTTLGTKFR